ncbi:MAG: GtrA family protein [Rikenellaceae bacterium]
MVLRSINQAVANGIGWLIERLYISPIDRIVSRQMLRYIVCGVLNYIVFNALLYHFIYNYIIHKEQLEVLRWIVSSHVATLIIVFPITFFMGFWFNRYVAFRATERTKKSQMVRYLGSIAGSLLISYVLLKLLVEHYGVWPTPANVICSLITSIYSYLMARFFTFVTSKKGQD